MASEGEPGSVWRRHFAALATARNLASAGGGTTIGLRHGVGFAELVEALASPADASRARAPEAGRKTASVQPSDIVAVYPRRGRRRLLRLPPLCDASDANVRASTGRPPDGARWILAVAPECYDRSDVAGSETAVILDPLPRWTGHASLTGSGLDAKSVVRAWEVYSGHGEALGLILCTGDAFVSVGEAGRVDDEATLEGAAWQISANR